LLPSLCGFPQPVTQAEAAAPGRLLADQSFRERVSGIRSLTAALAGRRRARGESHRKGKHLLDRIVAMLTKLAKALKDS
jgi:hypothetical protein